MSQRAYLRDEEKERFWRDVVERHAQSGLGVREFCRAEDVSEPSFYGWRRTLRQRDQENAFLEPSCAPEEQESGNHVVTQAVGSEESKPHIEIVTPDGWCIRVPPEFDSEALEEVLKSMTFAIAQHE